MAADAFGIPNAWLKLSEKVIGHGFKFRDYYSIYGPAVSAIPLHPRQIKPTRLHVIHEEYTRPGLDEIKQGLLAAFPFKP